MASLKTDLRIITHLFFLPPITIEEIPKLQTRPNSSTHLLAPVVDISPTVGVHHLFNTLSVFHKNLLL